MLALPRSPKLVMLVAALLVLPMAAAVQPDRAEAAATCPSTPPPLVPQLRDVSVNQGLGSYPVLVRSKETLVRVFLSLPECTARNASIALNSATLSVSNAGAPLTPTPIAAYSPTTSSTPPTLATYVGAAALNAPADATFVVPPTTLAPGGVTTRFTANFVVTVNYTANGVRGAMTFTTRPGTTTPITAVVEKPTKALRVLVVPMGDSRKLMSTEFSTAARTATVNGMSTLNRILPVATGTGDLVGGTGGLRYTINPTLLPLDKVTGGIPTGGGVFCGTSTNFDPIKAQLATFLQSWNTANPNSPADRVLGVVAGSISSGSNAGCAEGMAAAGGTQAWVRAIPATSTAPSMTGALMGMEMAHTMGVVPPSRADAYSPYHSISTQADGTAPGRAYNVSLRSYLADDHTVMTYVGTWNDSNTVLERDDWAMMLCRFGGAATPDCTTPGTVGTATGVGANPTFVISGTTNGSAAGTGVTESYFAAGVARTPPVDPTVVQPLVDVNYWLVQYAGTSVVRSDRVAVALSHTHHESPGGPATDHSDVGSFSSAVEWNTATTNVRLLRGAPGTAGSVVLYDRARVAPPQVVTPPVVDGAGSEPSVVTYMSTAADEYEPAISPDGTMIAWTEAIPDQPTRIRVALRFNPEASVVVDSFCDVVDDCDGAQVGEASWAPDSSGIVFRDGFGITRADVLFSENEGVIAGASERLLLLPSDRPYSPVLSLDGNTLAYLIYDGSGVAGQLWTITDGGDPTPVNGIDQATALTWSRTAGDNRLAYQDHNSTTNQYDIYVVDPFDSPAAPTLVFAGGRFPSWGTDGRIAFTRGGTWTVRSDGIDAQQVTFSPADLMPSLVGETIAFTRGMAGARDIYLLLPGEEGSTQQAVSFGVSGPNPDRLVADLIYSCGGVNYPLVVAVPPDSITGTTASFTMLANTESACSGGSFSVAVNDGVSRITTSAADATSTAQPPVAAVAAPTPSQRVLQFDSVPLRGAAKDAEDGELTDLSWKLTRPDGSAAGAGSGSVVDLAPPQGGWAPGDYTVELTGTDSSGSTATDTSTFRVLADADHNGLPDGLSTPTCPLVDAFADADGDGMPNLDDYTTTGAPCAPATTYGATAVFNPDPFPLSSTGNTVTVYVRIPYRNPTAVNSRTVRISLVEGKPTAFSTTAWTVSAGVATAKFDRQKLVTYLRAERLLNRRVGFTVTGSASGGAWSFTAQTTTFIQP